MLQQHTDAIALIQAIGKRIEVGNLAPVVGYKAAGELIGRGSRDSRYVGQVCSMCDAAAFVAGWPFLMVHFVRKPDGNINEAGFAGWWAQWRSEIVGKATAHVWTADQIRDLVKALSTGMVPSAAAKSVWNGFEDRGASFVEYNLHRKLKPAR